MLAKNRDFGAADLSKPSKKIRKALFPVAGMGTRFLPATKANPKEMMPIVDKPLIQFAVEEAIAAGITELIFVTSSSKRAIEDHFDSHFELEARLASQQKYALLDEVRNVLPTGVSCVYIRQSEPLGLGHAVLCARPVIGDEPFAVLLADDLVDNHRASSPCLETMLTAFEYYQASVIAIEVIDLADCQQYGMVGLGKPVMDERALNLSPVNQLIEKPKREQAPSHWAVMGRYVLSPKIFGCLEQLSAGLHQELQLTDALAHLLEQEPIYAHRFSGKRYDCGKKLGYLQAIVQYGLKHPEVGEAFSRYLSEILDVLDLEMIA